MERRKAIALILAGSAVATANPVKALEACAPFVRSSKECGTANFSIYGQQIIKELKGSQEVNSMQNPNGPVGVDLRLSLDQDPTKTYMWGTFKAGQYQEEAGEATLIQMGPVINGVEHGKPILDLYTKRFSIQGCYDFDTEALVNECGEEVLRPAWKVNVERIVKEGGNRVFRYEFSFPVVPNCGDAERGYIDTVKHQIVVPTMATPVPVTTPGTGTPGRAPAQLPRGGDGSTDIEVNPNIPRWPGH